MNKMFWIIFFMGGVVGEIKDSTIQMFESNPGIYYERIRDVRLTDTDWKMVVFLDVELIFSHFSQLRQDLNNSLLSCLQVREEDCQTLLDVSFKNMKMGQLHLELSILNKTLEDLSLIPDEDEFQEVSRLRKRMVPLGFVGTASSYLFGTATLDDINKIHTEIDSLQNSEKSISTILGRQTHIVKSALEDVHVEMKNQQKQVNILGSKVNDAIKKGITLEQEYNIAMLLNKWNLNFSQHLDYLSRTCKELRAAIYAARRGELLPNLLTTEQLVQLSRSLHHDKNSRDFPIAEDKINPEIISDLAKTRICYSEGRLLLVLHIPLLKKDEYTLYKMHSLPVIQDFKNKQFKNVTAYIAPQTPYIIIGKSKINYLLAEEAFIQYSCKQTLSHFICPQDLPLIDAGVNPDCEFSIFSRPHPELFSSCNIKMIEYPKTFWKKINSNGGWLFSIPRQDFVTISCPNEEDKILKVQGAGILHLDYGCFAKTKSLTLQSTTIVKSVNNYVYKTDLNLEIKPIEFSSSSHKENVNTDFSNSIESQEIEWKYEDTDRKLVQLEKDITQLNTPIMKEQQIHLWTLTSVILVIVVVVVLLMRKKIFTFTHSFLSTPKHKDIPLEQIVVKNERTNEDLTPQASTSDTTTEVKTTKATSSKYH